MDIICNHHRPRLRAVLILFIIASVGGYLRAQVPLASCTFRFSGTGFGPALTETWGLVRSPVSIAMVFAGGRVPEDGVFRAVLDGPGLPDTGEAVTVQVGDMLVLDGALFPVAGDYRLRDLSWDSGNGSPVPASPSAVIIHILDQVLSTSVETSRLSEEEMAELGIQTDPSSYDGYRVSISLGLESGHETIEIPVLLPAPGSDTAGWSGESAEAVVAGIRFPQSAGGGTVAVGTIRKAGGSGESGSGLSLPAIVYFPGNVGYLHNFFKAILVVINTSPADANLVVTDLTGTLHLPPGPDQTPGTPENPGDDPLRPARTANGYQTELPVMNPGPDGELGTADDTGRLAAGDTGMCRFLVEGLQEGTHTITIDLAGTLVGGGSDLALEGSAGGKVLVRNPDFSVAFQHPDVVRSGQSYPLVVTVTNTSPVPAAGMFLQFDSSQVLGGYFMDSNGNMLQVVREGVTGADGGSLQPGETARVTFHVIPTVTGRVVASYLGAQDGTVSLSLSHGEDDRGVALSPDSIRLSWPFYELPDDYRQALETVLGDALSVATAPELPAGVIPIRGYGHGPDDELKQLATAMILSGLYHYLSEPLPTIVLRNMVSLRTISPGIEQLFRRSDAAAAVRTVESAYLNGILDGQGVNGLMTAVKVALCDRPDYRPLLLDGVQDVEVTDPATGLGATIAESTIPGVWLTPLNGNRVLIMLPVTATGWDVTAPLTGTTIRTLAGTPHGFRRYTGSGGVGHRLRLHLADTGERVRLDGDGNGSLETELAGSEIRVDYPAPALLSVRQMDPDFLPGGSPFGDTLLAVFNRELDVEQLGDAMRYGVEQNEALTVRPMPDGRAVAVLLRRPVGRFVPRTLTMSGVTDRLAEFRRDVRQAITPSDELAGFHLSGTLFDPDGRPVGGHRIDAVVSDFHDTSRRFVLETDDEGRYELEQVTNTDRYPFGVRLHVILDNKRRDPQVRGRFTGRRIRQDIHFTGTGTVRVLVKDAARNPVPGATVALSHQVELYNRAAETDGDGVAVFERVHVGPFTIHAVKQDNGTTPATVWSGVGAGNLVRAGSEQVVTVYMEQRTGTVTGHLLAMQPDGNGGTTTTPIVGEAVVLFCEFENTGGGSLDPRTQTLVIRDGQGFVPMAWQYAGTDGDFRFDNVPAGRFFLAVTTDDAIYSGTQTVFLLSEGETRQLDLVRQEGGCSVFGEVRDGRGALLPGATVEVTSRTGSRPTVLVVTDALGAYEVTGLPAGDVDVRARYESRTVTASAVCTPDQPRVRVDLALPPVGAIHGVVRDAAGHPIPGQLVTIPPFDPGAVIVDPISGSVTADGQRSCIADSEGRYRFTGLQPGVWTVTAKNGTRAANGKATIRFDRDDVALDLALLPAGTVIGRVVQADGHTGAMARVTLRCNVPSDDPQRYGILGMGELGTVISDADGSFRFSGVNAGPVTVTATNVFASESAMAETTLTGEGQVVSVELRLGPQPTGRIAGRVLLPDGRSQAGAGVQVRLTHRGLPDIELTTGADGGFAAPPILPAGDWLLTAVDPVTGWMGAERLVLPLDGNLFVPVRLRGSGTVFVTVQNPDGSPITDGVAVFSERLPDGTGDSRTLFFSNPDGLFQLDRVLEGPFTIAVTASDGRAGRVAGQVDRNGQQVRLTVTMGPAGRMTGQVTAPDGETPVGSAELTVVDLQTGRPVAFGSSSTLPEDLGAFTFDQLPPGSYAVTAFDVANARYGETAVQIVADGTVRDVTVRLRGSGSVSGTVRTGSGEPAASVQVRIEAGQAPMAGAAEAARYARVELTTMTDGTGRFRFDAIPEGPFHLTAHQDETGAAGGATGEIRTDGEQVTRDIQLDETGSVHVAVLHHDGSPIPYAVVTLERVPIPAAAGGGLILHGVADERGALDMEQVPVGNLTVTATDPSGIRIGTVTAALTRQGDRVSVAVRDAGRGAVFGSVTLADGTPVTAGAVRLAAAGWSTGTAIAGGNYRIEQVPYGGFTVTATAMAQVRQMSGELGPDPLSGHVDIVLSPTGRVAGSLVNTDGELVPNQPVSIRVDGSPIGVAVTDATGAFSMAQVPYGSVRATAQDRITGAGASGSGLLDADHPELVLDLRYETLGRITGRVLDRDGGAIPAPGAYVTVSSADRHLTDRVPVQADGSFAVDRLPVGDYQVRYDDGWGNGVAAAASITDSAPDVAMTVSLTDYRTVAVTVRDRDGQPAADSLVTLAAGWSRTGWTDGIGTVRFTHVPFGAITVTAADAEELHRASSAVTLDDTTPEPVSLSLQFAGMIRFSGRVVSAVGDPLSGVPVRIQPGAAAAFTGVDGGYAMAVPLAADGAYTITATAGGTVPLTGVAVRTLSAAENVDGGWITGVDVTLEPAATLSGSVVAIGDGSPIAAIPVTFTCRGATVYRHTDGSGRFTVGDLPLHEPVRIVLKMGSQSLDGGTVTLTGDTELAPILLDATPPVVTPVRPIADSEVSLPFDLEIHWTDAETGVDLDRTTVAVNGADLTTALNRTADGATMTVADLSGGFRFGTNRLTVHAVNGQGGETVTDIPFTITEIPTSVTGLVYRADGTLAGPGLTLTLENPQGAVTATTGADGAVHFDGIGFGPFTVTGDLPDEREHLVAFGELTVSEAERNRPFRFYRCGTVSGTVFTAPDSTGASRPVDADHAATVSVGAVLDDTFRQLTADTDDTGQYRILYVPMGFHDIQATQQQGPHVSDPVQVELHDAFPDAHQDLTFLALGTLTGTVQSATGDPVPSGTVTVRVADGEGRTRQQVSVPITDGAFTVNPVTEGAIHVIAESDGLSGSADAELTFEGQAVAVAVTLSPDRVVTGRVLHTDGTAAAGAAVALRWEATGAALRTSTADGSGGFRFDHLPAGRFVVTASGDDPSGHGFVRSDGIDLSTDTTADLGDLMFATNTAPTVTVRSVSPLPEVYAGGSITVVVQASDAQGLDRITARTTGCFETVQAVSLSGITSAERTMTLHLPRDLDLSGGGGLTLSVSATDDAGETVDEDPVALTVIIDATPPVLTVELPDGSPMPDGYTFTDPPVNLTVHYVDPETGVDLTLAHDAVLNDTGNVGGGYWYADRLYWYFDQLTPPLVPGVNHFAVTVTNGAGLSASISGTFAVGFSYRIEGQVTTADGSPAGPDVPITFRSGDLTYSVVTDADGRYRVDNVQHSRSYGILADLQPVDGSWRCVRDSVTVSRDTKVVAKDLHLYAYGRVTGTVYRAPRRGEPADLRAPYTGNSISIYTDRTHTDSVHLNAGDGTFVMDYLPLGDYVVHGWVAGNGIYLSWQTTEAPVTLDDTSHEAAVELFVPALNSISGAFLDATGARVSDHRFRLVNLDTGEVVWQSSRWFGDSYSLYRVPAGCYHVETTWQPENLPGTSGEFTVSFDNESQTVDVVLAPYRSVQGTILQPDGVTPAAGADVTLTAAGRVQTAVTGADGVFAFTHVYNAPFTLAVSHGSGTGERTGDFSAAAAVDLGAIVLDADRPPTVSGSIGDTTVLQGGTVHLTVTASDDGSIASWGYRLSGVLTDNWNQPVTGASGSVSDSAWIDIPADTSAGVLTIVPFAVDNAGQEGDGDAITVTVEKRYLDWNGVVYRSDGVTPAVDATVTAVWHCLTPDGDLGNQQVITTDASGTFSLPGFFDRSAMCLDGSSQVLRVVWQDAGATEVAVIQRDGTPATDVNETVVLEPPVPPSVSLEVNPDVPLFMAEGYTKPALARLTHDWPITDLSWTVTGMFENSGNEWVEPEDTVAELAIGCPPEWFPDSVPTSGGTIQLTATVTDELGQTVTSDPITVSVAPARATVSGRLLLSDGAPAAGGEVFLRLAITGRYGPVYEPDTFYTVADADGVFRFEDILQLDAFQWEEVLTDDNWTPTGFAAYTATVDEIRVRGNWLTADRHETGSVPVTALPTGDLDLGDLALQPDAAPIVVVADPLAGSAVVTGSTIPVTAYVNSDTTPVTVTATSDWSVDPVPLTDQGERTDFRWGGRTGYHEWTGTLTIPENPEGYAWYSPVSLSVTATDGTGRDTTDTRTLSAFTLGEGESLPVPPLHVVYPGLLLPAPIHLPGMVLPVQVLDNTGNAPDWFRFAPARYASGDLFSDGGGGFAPPRHAGKGAFADGVDGYGELADPDHFASTHRLRLTLEVGVDDWDNLRLIVDVPAADGYEAHPAGDLTGDLSAWSGKDVVLTGGTLLIDGQAAFGNLIIATGAVVQMSGNASLAVAGKLVLMPGARIENINAGGTPVVTVSGDELFLYGDYTGKPESAAIQFQAVTGIHEQ